MSDLIIGRGSTPTITIDAHGVDLSSFRTIFLLSQSGHLKIEKDVELIAVDREEPMSTVQVRLTQPETLSLSDGKFEIQLRYVSSDGSADITDILAGETSRVLREGVIDDV